MPLKHAVGIDLGTTYSGMAWVNETGQSVVLPNDEGDLLTPSVVLFEDHAIVVGKEAKKVAFLSPDRVASCAKRDMGKPVYSRPIRGKYLPPEVIQSYILKKLRDDITRKIGPDYRTIITVPAYFDEPRRRATHNAGDMAGLDVLDILNEPTAAALAFGEDLGYLTKFGAPKERMNVIVYDLGGGTFDVTLIDMQAGNLRTLCTDGDVQLGGYDWDMRLVDIMAEAFLKQHGTDPRHSPAGLQRALILAEETKHTLSVRTRMTVTLAHEGKSTEITVTRDEFEERCSDLLERTRHTTKQLLAASGLPWKEIKRVLLTGGSTRMPAVPRMLRELTGMEPDMSVNPDEAVARGAAIYARYQMASRGETAAAPTFEVTNVNAHSLGVEGIDSKSLRKRNKVLIPRNSQLPAKRVEECITAASNQRTVVVQVLEGESHNPEECAAIGRTVIRDLPASLPQGWPVQVTYEYGVNGRLCVMAKVRGTDREVKLELERDESLSADRVNRWKRTVAKAAGLNAFEAAIEEELEQLRQGVSPTNSPTAPAVPTRAYQPAATPKPAWTRPIAPAAGGGARELPERLSSEPASKNSPAATAAKTATAKAAAAQVPSSPESATKPTATKPSATKPAGAKAARPVPIHKPTIDADEGHEGAESSSKLLLVGYVTLVLATLIVSYLILIFAAPSADFLGLRGSQEQSAPQVP